MHLFGNPIIGIIFGVLAGILAFLGSRYFLSLKEDKETKKIVKVANEEIMHALRPLLAEQVVPPTYVTSAILAATSDKYEIPQEELYSPAKIVDHMIKEVVDNTFLSAPQKLKFCGLVAGFNGNEKVVLCQDFNQAQQQQVQQVQINR
ncbi:MAG: hypothetical protein SNJ70_06200 [Armatimonadota bacterium]